MVYFILKDFFFFSILQVLGYSNVEKCLEKSILQNYLTIYVRVIEFKSSLLNYQNKLNYLGEKFFYQHLIMTCFCANRCEFVM